MTRMHNPPILVKFFVSIWAILRLQKRRLSWASTVSRWRVWPLGRRAYLLTWPTGLAQRLEPALSFGLACNCNTICTKRAS